MLDLLSRAVNEEHAFSAPVHRWLHGGLRAYLDGTGAQTLEVCLGIQPPPGARSLSRRLAQAKQMRAIVEAWRSQGECDGVSSWERCEILAKDVAVFGESLWPAWRKSGGPPSEASQLRRALFAAFAAMNSPPPKSQNGIYELLKRAGELT